MRERTRRRLSLLAAIALVLVCVVVVGAVLLQQMDVQASTERAVRGYSPQPNAATPSAGRGPVIAVVGDAGVDGAATGVDRSERWPALLATRLGGTAVTFSRAGSGYIAKSGGETFESEAEELPIDADIVLFVGGAADNLVPRLDLARAATNAYSRAAQLAPDATVVVVGPVFRPLTTTTANLTVIRSTLQSAAAVAEIPWIDPVRSKWLSEDVNSPSELNAEAQQTIADRMATSLRAAIKEQSAQ